MNYLFIFLTGLTSGGVSCAALQGGFLASAIANQKLEQVERGGKAIAPGSFGVDDWGPVTAFLTAKLLIHMALGALLGVLGGVLVLSATPRLIFQAVVSLFMIATAGNLLEIHPIFRYLSMRPPRFAYKLIKNTTSRRALFTPALLGLLTIFIPCGVTQAMEVLAINSGSPVVGALTMGAFVAGTAPMFFVIGIATAKFSEVWRRHFLRAAAAVLVIMGLVGLNGVATALDAPLALDRLGPKLVALLPPYNMDKAAQLAEPTVAVVDGVQKVKIAIENTGYSPSYVRVARGVPVELTLTTATGVYSCAASFTFRSFGIADYISPGTFKVHTFTPTQAGLYTFSCSMGMYTGTMEVL